MYASPKGGIIRDAPGERFGELPLSEIVINSSNIGMAKLGESLGNPVLYRIATAFGYGARTGVDIPGEAPGKLLPISRWTSYDTVRLPFGQGQIMVTAMQLANGFATIANGGTLHRPYVIDRVITPDGQIVYQGGSQTVRRVISQAVAKRFVDEVLVNVVEEGTGKKAKSDYWKIFGKTGTAQIGGPGGYADRAFTGTFVGGGPASDPQIICVISVYHPNAAKGHFGGTVAAPFVKTVLEKTLSYMDVQPDKTDETQEDVAQR
jgi:cell division protein FtsI/penicillin-binding protein 2